MRTPITHALLRARSLEFASTLLTASLDWRCALNHLLATLAFQQGTLQPFARASGSGERNLNAGLATRTQ